MKTNVMDGQVSMFAPDSPSGKMCRAASPADGTRRRGGKGRARTSGRSSRRSSRLRNQSFMLLNLRTGAGNILGPYWETDPQWLGCGGTLNTSECPKDVAESSLSAILQENVPSKYYLTRKACLGILRRAVERRKDLPEQLELALKAQAGLIPLEDLPATPLTAFAANQRDEVRDLHDKAGALAAQPGMKQQTFIAQDCLTPWDTQQARVFTPEGKAPALTGADGGGGRNPAGLLFSAAFCAGAGSAAGSIGYQEEVAPTLKGSASGNMMPSVLCLNDQGGSVMECSENVTGTLRAQEHGHQPLVVKTQRGKAKAAIFENHGIDARYTGPHPVSPTLPARAGTGGNNLPLVSELPKTLCILGNAVDCAPENGGHGLGVQEDLAYTLTSEHRHAVFTRQRTDSFQEGDVASTESARQYKDAADLICTIPYQDTVGALTSSDHTGPNSPYMGQDKLVVGGPLLIRRLTPLECERLQGFPDGWTDIPGASDSARYRALGNSVAIPCVEFIMRGFVMAMGTYPRAMPAFSPETPLPGFAGDDASTLSHGR